MSVTANNSWFDNMKVFLDKRAIAMLFLGFSAGLPILLIFSSLSLWLREAGVSRSAVTYFSWAALGYSFKFIWAPLVDKLPIPFLTRVLGRRRSWLLFSQLLIIIAISWMGLVDPAGSQNSLNYMAMAAVLLGFSSATQDISIDAFRIESAESNMQATLAATYIAGYRIGMVIAGAGSLYIASYFGSKAGAYSYNAWMKTYLVMATFMIVGVMTTIFIPEPQFKESQIKHSNRDYFTFFILFLIVTSAFVASFSTVGPWLVPLKKSLTDLFSNKHLAGLIVSSIRLSCSIFVAILISFLIGKSGIVNIKMLNEGYVDPVKNFFERYGKSLAWSLLALVGLYRISDIVLGVISNVFYQDLGFTKIQIANAVKFFGVVMSICGGLLGGLLTTRYGVMKILWWGAVLSAATNLLFMLLAYMGNNVPMLYGVVAIDNLAAGLASAAFVAFLSSLTDISFTAVQYAIFSSLMTLLPKVLGGYSGSIVDAMGYQWFFLFTTLIGVPVLAIVYICGKKFKLHQEA